MLAQIALYPPRASTTADSVDQLFFFLLGVTMAVGLLVAILLIGFAVQYRRRPGETQAPPETHAPHSLEWFWTLTPLVIFMVMFVWGANVYFGAFRAPDDATPIYGIGKQWMWKFQQPQGQREINELHVAVGRPYRMILTSEDVLHSFFVPDFRIHMDVLPDRYTSVWFQATMTGRFHLFCSQYCGTNHSVMVGEVVVMEPQEYENWLHLHAEGSAGMEGQKIFRKYRCISCHSINSKRAPVLSGVYGRPVHLSDGRTIIADDDYIRRSILDPGADIVAGYENIMPTFKGQISAEEINQVIAWLRAMDTPPAAGVPPDATRMPNRVEDYPPPPVTPDINNESTAPAHGGTNAKRPANNKQSEPKR